MYRGVDGGDYLIGFEVDTNYKLIITKKINNSVFEIPLTSGTIICMFNGTSIEYATLYFIQWLNKKLDKEVSEYYMIGKRLEKYRIYLKKQLGYKHISTEALQKIETYIRRNCEC